MIMMWTRREIHDFLVLPKSHFEPEAPRVQGGCSTGLSYGPI